MDRNLLRGCRDSVFERVALRKESVDRNYSYLFGGAQKWVALRKESVDRNHDGMLKYRDAEVALRKESVDRNTP